MSRKALGSYEAAGILAVPRRSGPPYHTRGNDVLALLAFVQRA